MNQIGNNPMNIRVSIRVSSEERELIERYARMNGISVSVAIRDILERHVKEQTK